MRNSESRKKVLFTVITLVLLGSLVLGAIRIEVARHQLLPQALSRFSETYGVVTDRYGLPLYDGEVEETRLFGNLLDSSGMTEKTITQRFSKELQPGEAGRWGGWRTLEEEPRVMKTTLLPADTARRVADALEGQDGCVYAFNYETGETYLALSMPALGTGKEGSFQNQCIDGSFVPGSTMKVVTSIVALEQGMNLEKLKFTCEGTYTLYDGSPINCTGIHGEISYTTALEKSCNCFFAQMILGLNLDEAIESLTKLGFSVNENPVEEITIDRMSKKASSTLLSNTVSFQNVWGLIGQGDTLANPIDMARIIGAILNDGEAVTPYFVESVVNPNEDGKVIYQHKKTDSVRIMSKDTARKMKEYMGESIQGYYVNRGVNKKITYGKTGTAQVTGGMQSLFLGVCENSKTAFMIVVRNSSPTGLSVANILPEVLPID